MVTLDPRHPLDKALRGAVSDALTGWLERRRDTVLAISPDLAPMADRAAAILSGGKRMRPAFCVWGAVAVGGVPTGPTPPRSSRRRPVWTCCTCRRSSTTT